MWKKLLLLGALGLISAVLPGSPANAQATRSWVSGVGDDANPCSRTAPCKTFAGAMPKTVAGGEINCLDPGGFGGVTITKAITILCDGVSNGGVLVSGTNGINVALPGGTSRVVLSGLDFEGLGTGLSGVLTNGPGQVIIRNSTIRNFTTAGVNVQGTAGPPNARVVLDNVLITNSNVGLNVAPAAGVTNEVFVFNSVIDSNTTGISVTTAGGTGYVYLSASILTGQATAITGPNGVYSYGNNVIRGTITPALIPQSLQ